MNNNILTVGSIAFDSIKTIKGSCNNIIGGSSTYFSIAASKYANVHIVGIVGNDFPQSGWELYSNNNIDVSNVQVKEGKTFSWGGEYSDNFSSRQTLYTDLGVFEHFTPAINTSTLQSKYVFLGNIQPSLQLQVKKQVELGAIIVLDTMNLWIDNNARELMEVICDIDVFMLNDEEALQLTNMHTISAAGEKLISLGAKSVVIKQGADGSTLFHENQQIHIGSVPNVNVYDPTGAGDSFAGGFVGYLAKHDSVNYINAIIHGTAIASFTVGNFGVQGLLDVSNQELQNRINLLEKIQYG